MKGHSHNSYLPMVIGIKGEYVFTKCKGGLITQPSLVIPNLITDLGMNMLGGTAAGVSDPTQWHHYLQLGNGVTVPSNGDTSLSSFLVSAFSSAPLTSNVDTTNGWLIGTKTWAFLNGEAAGNVSEVGLGAAANGKLFSRSLMRNLYGQVSLFTVLPDEDLYVTYRIFLKQPDDYQLGDCVTRTMRKATVDSTGWALASGRTVFSAIATGSSAAVHTGDIGIATSSPAGGVHTVTPANIMSEPYVADSFNRTYSYLLSRDEANTTIKSLSFLIGPTAWQIQLPTPVVKTPNDNYRFRVRLTWARSNNDAYYSE